MTNDNLSTIVTTAGGGFFVGIFIGWALKKIVKLFAIIAGLFLAGMTYLHYQNIASINWDKLQQASGVVNTLVYSTINITDSSHSEVAELAITNLGIPLTGSLSIGFTIGFMKG